MPQIRSYFVYIMTNRSGALYTGVSSDLTKRVPQHRSGTVPGFTSRYRVDRLVWFDVTSDVLSAIAKEKQIKGWRRARKFELIRATNPNWLDLAEDWLGPVERSTVVGPSLEGGLPRPGAASAWRRVPV